jgi:hypothetical protein
VDEAVDDWLFRISTGNAGCVVLWANETASKILTAGVPDPAVYCLAAS